MICKRQSHWRIIPGDKFCNIILKDYLVQQLGMRDVNILFLNRVMPSVIIV